MWFRLKKNWLNRWSAFRPMVGMNSWPIWQRVILSKLHTVTIHHAKIRSKNYLPRDSMSKQERHLWEQKHSACHLNQSNHFAKRLKANVFVQVVKRRLLVSHSLDDHIKGRRSTNDGVRKNISSNNRIVQTIKSNFFRNKNCFYLQLTEFEVF